MSDENLGITQRTQDTRVSLGKGGIQIKRRGKPVGGEIAALGYVYLVIDCSASMAGDKIEQARQGALDFAREAFSRSYAVGLIQFDTTPFHICEPQQSMTELMRHVYTLSIGKLTNMAGGIQMAADRLLHKAGARVIVLVTDGYPDNPDLAVQEAERAKSDGIDIITIGTDDADRLLLGRIATRTDLSQMVTPDRLSIGIAGAAKMLPETGR